MPNVTTFGTLKSELLSMLGREPADWVYQVVTREINTDLRLSTMIESTSVTEAASVSLSAVSPEVLQIVSIYRDVTPRCTLTPTTPQALQARYHTSGAPTHFAFVDDALLLNRPGSGETLQVQYYGALALMSGDDDTSDTLTTYPEIFIYGALAHHAQGIRDFASAAQWGGTYEAVKKRAVARDRASHNGPAPVSPTPPYTVL